MRVDQECWEQTIREQAAKVWQWSGSAFLAGEKVEDEEGHKADLYSWLCGLGNTLERLADTVAPPDIKVLDALALMDKHKSWSLGFHDKVYGDDDEQPTHGKWVIWDETGNINDREWLVIASGETPIAAIRAALSTNGSET
jgi:hypothetical protein